jgi:GH15 family glucan-1,4-alpha-glucosidase
MRTRLEDYALIGDCETAALVSRAGSSDWLCWPRFDSGACFAALLGGPEHGRWLIEAVDANPRITRRYRGHTLILETQVETSDGAATVIDFMPPRGRNSDIVRIVRGERGRVRMRTELVLRFDYGRSIPWVNHLHDGTFRAIAGPDMVLLYTPVPLCGRDLTTIGEFDVTAGTTTPFVLMHVLIGRLADARRLFERLLALRNDVGLLSEEYDTGARRLVGNVPQAFSHIALINTAHSLGRASKPVEQRAAS